MRPVLPSSAISSNTFVDTRVKTRGFNGERNVFGANPTPYSWWQIEQR